MSEMAVSIIIPTYNYGRFLTRCVDAALAQTSAPVEVIVVDDGSTDSTQEVMRAYEGRVQYIHQANQGLSGARNTGARHARGDWFLFCDADDMLAPRAVEWLTAAVTGTAAGVVYGKCRELYEDGRAGAVKGTAVAAGLPPIPAKANFWKSLITTTGAALISRRTFDKVGGYAPSRMMVEDREFWIKAGMLDPFAFCNEVVLEKSTRADSMSSKKGLFLYCSMIVQLNFLDWCRERRLDTAGLGVTPADIAANAVCYTVRGAHWVYLFRSLREIRRRGLPHPGLLHAVVHHGVPEWLHQTRLALFRIRKTAGIGNPSAFSVL